LLKETNYRNTVMKTIKCTKCGDVGHIGYGCYQEANKDLVKSNAKEFYESHRENKSWQNYRRQVMKRIQQKRQKIVVYEETLKDIASQIQTPTTKIKMEEINKSIAGLLENICLAEKELEKRRNEMSTD